MSRILGRAAAAAAADPFGPGDPVEVARLVRRALAAAGRKAVDVGGMVVVAGETATDGALARFARRALGPHGETLVTASSVARSSTHDERVREAAGRAAALTVNPAAGGPVSVVVAVALGPDASATALCLDAGPA